MGMRANDVKQVYAIDVDNPDVIKYLHGETLRFEGEVSSGWTLVGLLVSTSAQNNIASDQPIDSCYPLGWGKHVRGLLKNHYPRGLLWQ